jgi:putative nucleotidyltransferase with HDIG domain
VESLTEAVLRTGFAYRFLGERELATDNFELALALGELHGDPGRASRAVNGLATVHYMHGELREARAFYQSARKLALQAGDVLNAGRIEQNLGVLAVIRGEPKEALKRYQAAVECYREVANERGVAAVLNNLGMLHINRRQFAAAAECLDEALEVSGAVGDVVLHGIVHLNRTELFLATDDLERAGQSCDEAFEIASRLRQHSNRSDALRFYGIIYRERGKPYLAEARLREAIEIAATHDFPLEEAEAQRELALVLRAQDRNREALEALNRARELFDGLQAKRKQADIDKRVAHLKDDFLSLVRAWGESIEAKDRYTGGHCQRVADYACRIAERIGLPEREMVWFRMGAFLHDVGKTEIPEAILNKPGRLTDEERLLMERHTVLGDEILSPIEFPWDIRPMVRSHHERWDGRGYPDGLYGEGIPLTARILRIADVFDALTTTRSYREPLSADQAFQIMENDHGAYDPELFELFRELLPEFAAVAGDAVPAPVERTAPQPAR